MPRYKIKDNRTGREISIKADKPPSAHYARMILSSLENQEHHEQGNSTQYTEPEGGIIPTIGRFSEKPIFGKQGNALDYVTPGLLAGIAPLALGPIGAGVSAGARGLSMLPRALQLAGGLAGRALPTAGYAADIGLLGSEAGLNLQRGNPGTAALNVAGLAGGYLAPTLLARLVGKRTGAAGLRRNPLSDETLPPPAPVRGTEIETPAAPVAAAPAPVQAAPAPVIDTPVPAPAPVEDLIPSPTPSVLPAQATLPPATPIGGKTPWTGKAAKASIRTAEQAEIEALSVKQIRQVAVETDTNPLVSPEIKAALDPEAPVVKPVGARGELEEFATKHGLELRDEKGRLNLYKGEDKLFSRGFGNAGKMLAGATKKYAKGEPTFHASKKTAKPVKAAVKPKVTTQTKLPTGQTLVATRTGQKFIAQSDETAGALEESIGTATKKVNDNIKTDMAEIPPPDLTGRSLALLEDADIPADDFWLDESGNFIKSESDAVWGFGRDDDGKIYLWNTLNGDLHDDLASGKDAFKLIQGAAAKASAKAKTKPMPTPKAVKAPAEVPRVESKEAFLALPKKQQNRWRKLKVSADASGKEASIEDAVVFDIIDEIDYKPDAPVVAKPKAEAPRKAMADIKTQEEFNALPEEHINELMHTIDNLKHSDSPVLEDPNVIRTVKFIEGYLKKQAEVF